MYTKTIKYIDYDDVPVVEEVNFNLTKTELMEYIGATIEVEDLDGNDNDEIVKSAQKKLLRKLNLTKGADIIGFIKDLVLRSYGIKSEDGRKFIKVRPDGTKLADEFVQSIAFDTIMSELTDDPKKADEFMFAIMPRSIAESVKQRQAENTTAPFAEKLSEALSKLPSNGDVVNVT